MDEIPADRPADFAGCIGDGGVEVLTDTAVPTLPDAALDPAELFDVDVAEFARPVRS